MHTIFAPRLKDIIQNLSLTCTATLPYVFLRQVPPGLATSVNPGLGVEYPSPCMRFDLSCPRRSHVRALVRFSRIAIYIHTCIIPQAELAMDMDGGVD